MAQKYIVGDIVMYKNRIHTIIDTLRLNNYELSYVRHPVNRAELSGVPLTPEILLKNGWMLYHLYYWFTEEECLKLRLLKLDKRPWNAYIGDNIMRVNIHSVSDLQHLLFGLGLNSEMKV